MMLMLVGSPTRAATPSPRQSRPNHGRALPWPSPTPLAAVIPAIDGTTRCAWVRRTHWHQWPRQSCHRRRATPPSFLPPLSDSLTRGAPLSVAEAEAGASPRPRRVWVALARASWAAVCFRAGPAVGLGFHFCLFILFHRFVYIFKNMYLLVGRSK